MSVDASSTGAPTSMVGESGDKAGVAETPPKKRKSEHKKKGRDNKKKLKKDKKIGVVSPSILRIQKELADISVDPPPCCSAGPKGDDVREWVSAPQAYCPSKTSTDQQQP